MPIWGLWKTLRTKGIPRKRGHTKENMTFIEAAAEVLRKAGKPLHYKEITELAIAGNLLSHVGKTPEVTMSHRLTSAIKKNDKEVPITKIRPGVFALREWEEKKGKKGAAAVAAETPWPTTPRVRESVEVRRPRDRGAALDGAREPGGHRSGRRRRR